MRATDSRLTFLQSKLEHVPKKQVLKLVMNVLREHFDTSGDAADFVAKNFDRIGDDSTSDGEDENSSYYSIENTENRADDRPVVPRPPPIVDVPENIVMTHLATELVENMSAMVLKDIQEHQVTATSELPEGIVVAPLLTEITEEGITRATSTTAVSMPSPKNSSDC